MSLMVAQSPGSVAASMTGLRAPDPRAFGQPAGRTIERSAALKAAQQLVGETFFGTLLKELRKSTSKDHPLYGGRGEETLQPLLDQHLARRLAESRRFDLAQAIADRLTATLPRSNDASGAGGGAPESDRRRP